ncbi:C-type lectin 37Da-like [Topomyia yanbarensis]|uniref:C-type lectin 37Da-like n=1 Tax=Topomyia yanbarensis TaxID=2498891 RepID=UPI00273BC85B|nr:C-type lectin 37Da-like [Topomyia yanbarensis]
MLRGTFSVLILSLLSYCYAQDLKCSSESQYHIPDVTANWYKASEYCNSIGMRLAVISSNQQQDNLVAMIKSSSKYNTAKMEIWIGGSDLAKEGEFIWQSTGAKIGYANWNKKQPDNAGGNEHCVQIRHIPAVNWNWHWNDRDCKVATSH